MADIERPFFHNEKGAILTAREYFESASAAQRHIDALYRKIGAMRAREGTRSHGFEAVAGGGDPDPMRATDARMEAEEEARGEIAECDALIADAREVCRGIRRANVRHPLWGDCIELHFIELMPWKQVGNAFGITESGARHNAYEGLDWVDMVGLAAAREGMGGA